MVIYFKYSSVYIFVLGTQCTFTFQKVLHFWETFLNNFFDNIFLSTIFIYFFGSSYDSDIGSLDSFSSYFFSSYIPPFCFLGNFLTTLSSNHPIDF